MFFIGEGLVWQWMEVCFIGDVSCGMPEVMWLNIRVFSFGGLARYCIFLMCLIKWLDLGGICLSHGTSMSFQIPHGSRYQNTEPPPKTLRKGKMDRMSCNPRVHCYLSMPKTPSRYEGWGIIRSAFEGHMPKNCRSSPFRGGHGKVGNI